MEIINLDQGILEEAGDIFKDQEDTRFSFTDCTTIACMRGNIIKNLATFDKDFKKLKEINVIE